MNEIELQQDLSFPQRYWGHGGKDLFPQELISLIIKLHTEFEPERKHLLECRKMRQIEYDKGKEPDFHQRDSEAVQGKWKVRDIPPELQTRRVEITGPVNSAKMVINMLNRTEDGARADMAMLDFEDSMKPSFRNVLDGYKNVDRKSVV